LHMVPMHLVALTVLLSTFLIQVGRMSTYPRLGFLSYHKPYSLGYPMLWFLGYLKA
jgi:hypothetical protein